jgi:hypothetical protein
VCRGVRARVVFLVEGRLEDRVGSRAHVGEFTVFRPDEEGGDGGGGCDGGALEQF